VIVPLFVDKVPLFIFKVPATDAEVPKVNALLIFVVPAPDTALFNVPESSNVPAFVIVPPKLSAVDVKVAPEFIDTACAMLAELVTVPEITVEPAPDTAFAFVPALKVNVPALAIAPEMLLALVVNDLLALIVTLLVIFPVFVTAPLITVVPVVPLYAWIVLAFVPPVKVNVPAFDIVPVRLPAADVNDLPE
jgi:hypothetical protein